MNIDELIAQIRTTPDCEVYIPTGLPTIDEGHILPDDLRTFYELCGGVSLFQSDPYPLMETHGVAGSCPIIATSFTDLLTRLYENKGQRWYWLRPDFVSLGDAYDDV